MSALPHDLELLEVAREVRGRVIGSRSSCGRCNDVSMALEAALHARWADYEARLFNGDLRRTSWGHRTPPSFSNHVYIALPCGRVLDATADQFSGVLRRTLPPVYLGTRLLIHSLKARYIGRFLA